ncbi:MAG: hypothetical protein E6Q90_10265 [Actinobacteria bacterium]|nr:MAG: hypothetical protein E6Q90_10265 [Actinomycetota bacterium]
MPRVLAGIGLAALSAVMLFVVWDGHGNIWPLSFVAYVPMYVAAYRVLPRRWSGLAYGIAAFGYWLSYSMFAAEVVGPAAVLGIPLVLGLCWALVGSFERPFNERTEYRWFIVSFPLLWTALEVLAQLSVYIGSVFWFAYRLAPAPALAQPVSWFSSPALTFTLLLCNAGLALIVLRLMDRKWPALGSVAIPRRVWRTSVAVALGVPVAWFALSLAMYANVNSELGPTVRVASVQPGIAHVPFDGSSITGVKLPEPQNTQRNAALAADLDALTRDAAAKGARLVVWPEIIFDYDVYGAQGDWIRALARDLDVTLVVGYEPDFPDPEAANLAAVVLPDGTMGAQPYAKVHPVLLEGERFTAVERYPTYATPVGQLGVVICWDHDFADSGVRLTTLAGAEIVAIPALDPPSMAHLRWESLTFRAIENRVPLVKTDVGWDAAIINANGDLVQRIANTDEDGEVAVLVGDVNLGPASAVFTATGGYPFATLVVLGVVARYVWQIILWRRGRRLPVVNEGVADGERVAGARRAG